MTGEEFRKEVGELKWVTESGLDEVDDVNPSGKKKEVKKVRSVGNVSKFRSIKRDLRVLARSSPEDKLLLVTGMKQC